MSDSSMLVPPGKAVTCEACSTVLTTDRFVRVRYGVDYTRWTDVCDSCYRSVYPNRARMARCTALARSRELCKNRSEPDFAGLCAAHYRATDTTRARAPLSVEKTEEIYWLLNPPPKPSVPDPLYRACPVCFAVEGQQCTLPSGRVFPKYHAIRRSLATLTKIG